MRILFVNDESQITGGKEKYLAALRRALRGAGHTIGFIHSGLPPADLQRDEIRFWIPGLATYRGTPETIRRLRDCTSLFRPDVIHIHQNAVNLIAVGWLANNFPVLRSVHDVELLCPIRYYVRVDTGLQCDARCGAICFSSGCLELPKARSWYRLLRTKAAQWLYSRRSRLNTHSRYLQQNLLNTFGRPEVVSVIPLFVSPVDQEMKIETARNRVLFVGRLNYWKGPQVAIKAMANAPADAILEIAGTGNYEPALRTLVRDLKLEPRVRFLGLVTGDALAELYQRATAVVVPSLVPENCPLSVQEAMAAGRPVIGTNAGGIPELVLDGITGLIVPPNDAAAMSSAMRRLLEDPDFVRRLGQSGRAAISRAEFQLDHHLSKLFEEYEATIERFRRRAGSLMAAPSG